MKRLFKWLLILAAVLAIGLTLLVYNPGLVKRPLERYLSDVAGYPIRLEGRLTISPGRSSQITATDIRIGGPEWATHQNLIEVEFITLALDTGSLFEDIIVLESLQVDSLQLNLETNSDGHGNWLTANVSESDTGEERDEPIVVFNTVSVNDSALHFLNGKTGVEHILQISSLNQKLNPDGMLHLKLGGDFNERPVEFSSSLGPYTNLLDGHDISYDGSGYLGTLDIISNGVIDDLLQPHRPRLHLELQGPNIDEITQMFGVEDLGSGEFSLVAKGGEVNDHYEASVNGEIGAVVLGITAQASELSELYELDLDLVAHGPSLGAVTRTFGLEHWPDKPFHIKGSVERLGGTLNLSGVNLDIGGSHLALDALLSDFPNLSASRIKLLVNGDDVEQFRSLLGVSGVASGPFEIKGTLDVSPSNVELLQLEVQTELGRATISGTLGPAPRFTGSKFHLYLQGHNARTIMSAFDIDALPERPFSLDTHIELVENGLLVERGVLVTIDDEKLELGGFIAFNPGARGTNLEFRFNGKHLAMVTQRLVSNIEIPDLPYDLSGRIRFVEKGLELDNFKAELADIDLTASGLMIASNDLVGTGLDFQISGRDIYSLKSFKAIGNSVDLFTPGQSYTAKGRLTVGPGSLIFDDVSGQIGGTSISFGGEVGHLTQWTGSSVDFSLEGPGLEVLLADKIKPVLFHGAFKSSGHVSLSKDTLKFTDFSFETAKARGRIDLGLGWPFGDSINADFDLDFRGEDFRQLHPPTGLFELEKAPFEIRATGEKYAKHLALEHIDASIGNLNLSARGEVDKPLTDENFDINFKLGSEDISALGYFSGERLPPMALNLEAKIQGNAHEFVASDLKGSLGENLLTGSLEVSLTGERPEIKLVADSRYIDIRPFLASPDSKEKTGADTKQDRLIPATPLPLDALAVTDTSISLTIAELRARHNSIRNLVLQGETADGSLRIPELSLEGPRGIFNASLYIEPTGVNNADVTLDLEAEKFVLNISGQPEENLPRVPTYDIRGNVKGRGSNLREVAGSLNGALSLGSEGGSLEDVNLSLLDTFIMDEIFNLIMPTSKADDDLDVRCVAAIIEIKDGLMDTNPALAFTTSQISLIAKGTVDLKTEKMRFNFNAIPNKALKISASELFNPYILVSGTLSKPVVGLDPARVLLHGGAAVGTAGISILAKGLIDRLSNTVPLCEDMLDQMKQ